MALEELRNGKFVTSPAHYGYFRSARDKTEVFYLCGDSGCTACKSTYTIEEFLSLTNNDFQLFD